jgi:DnaJ-class molecular chaperone
MNADMNPVIPVAVIGARTAAAVRMLTAGLGPMEPNRSLCGRCRGKGFDCFTANRSSRKCPRCKGAGSTAVGNTKR